MSDSKEGERRWSLPSNGGTLGAGRYRDGRIIDRSRDALGGEAAWAALEEQLRTDGEA